MLFGVVSWSRHDMLQFSCPQRHSKVNWQESVGLDSAVTIQTFRATAPPSYANVTLASNWITDILPAVSKAMFRKTVGLKVKSWRKQGISCFCLFCLWCCWCWSLGRELFFFFPTRRLNVQLLDCKPATAEKRSIFTSQLFTTDRSAFTQVLCTHSINVTQFVKSQVKDKRTGRQPDRETGRNETLGVTFSIKDPSS